MLGKIKNLPPYLFFIISGGCGLVYEVVWSRYLGLFLGNTTLANMCVLAAYMGGLAIGSVVLGNYTQRMKRPLALYGGLEIFVGIYAVLFPHIINPIQNFALQAGGGLAYGSTALTILKLGTAAVVLLVPTILMGGTFPVLMRHFQPGKAGEDKGEWLYMANCGGGVTGAILAGFTLMPILGMSGTLTLVGIINIVLGLLAVVLAYIYAPLAVEEPAQVENKGSENTDRHPLFKIVTIILAVSGGAAMIYELVWIRIFAFTLGSSTYSFTLMVAAYITGLAIGSLLVGTINKLREQPLIWLAFAQIGIGIVVMLCIPLYERLPYIFWRWNYLLNPTQSSVFIHDLFKYSLCFIVMAVPTIFSGMTIPLAIKAVARLGRDIGKDSGVIYGANTGGTLIGSIVTGMVLISTIGLRHSLELALLFNVIMGIILLWLIDKRKSSRQSLVLFTVGVIVLLAIAPKWNPMSFTRGSFRQHDKPPATWADYLSLVSYNPKVFYQEHSAGTTVVLAQKNKDGSLGQKALFVDGKAEGSEFYDNPTQVLVSQLPLLFKPGARDVLMVGLGTGVSAGSVLTHPNAKLDCVEISPVVAKAARYFSKSNHDVLDNPRMNLIIEDARTVLSMTQKKYDAVINEPTNPWIAGMGNLFSLEFFKQADRILKPDGLIVQWFHTYEISDDLVRVIARTMHQVFPYTLIFQGAKNDYIIVGSRSMFRPDYNAMAKQMLVKDVKADLDKISVDSVDALLALQVLSPEGFRRFAGKGIINTDDHPVLEYQAPKAQYIGAEAEILRQSDERYTSGKNLLGVKRQNGQPLGQKSSLSILRAYSDSRMDNPRLQLAMLNYYVSKWPGDGERQWSYASMTRGSNTEGALAAANQSIKLVGDGYSYGLLADIELSRKMSAMSAYTPQDFSPVIGMYMKALNKLPQNKTIREHLKYARSIEKQ